MRLPNRYSKTGRGGSFPGARIWNGEAPAIDLVECKSCSFLFFNPRLEPEEEQKLSQRRSGATHSWTHSRCGRIGYVYDISDVEPLDGIGRCSNLRECQERKFDLIICSNVLEHVGFPRNNHGSDQGDRGAQDPHIYRSTV